MLLPHPTHLPFEQIGDEKEQSASAAHGWQAPFTHAGVGLAQVPHGTVRDFPQLSGAVTPPHVF